jgi:ribonuclease BN (tRNA processing enzyme)
VRLTIVGCAPAWTRRPGRASSCYLIEHDGAAVALDLGQGAFAELAGRRDPATLAAVLVSHLHPDHFIDLVPLRHFLKYEVEAETPPQVRGPAELRARLDALLGERGFLAALPGEVLSPGQFAIAGLAVEARRVTHIPDSFAFRLAPAAGAPGLVYSGDCSEADDLLPLLRAGDTLLCEAFYGADAEAGPLHLTAGQAAGVAVRGDAARLVLTHIGDGRDETAAARAAAQVFDGQIEVATPGLRLDIS